MIAKKVFGLGVLLGLAAPTAAHAIPAWARKYNVNCSACHAPAVPRLNSFGQQFRWAGYRMPDEIGQAVSVDDVKNYIAMRGRTQYVYEKTEKEPVSTSAFQFSDATFFFAGPFGSNFGAFFELEREAEDDIGLQAHIESAWGSKDSYGGFRVGLMHWLLRDGTAGFDRPTGLRTPTPFGSALTAKGIPFRFSKDQFGLELYYVKGRNRISGEVLNGVNQSGSGGGSDVDTKKDFVVTEQFLFDEFGSGLTAVGYYGSLTGADPMAESVTSHYWRVALSANKIVNQFEVLGGVVFGKDTDLPVVTGGAFPDAEVKAMGYFGYVGYSFPTAGHPVTIYGRYESVDPNSDIDKNAKRRFVFGGVLPVATPEYLRLAVEYALDSPQTGVKTHGLTFELMLNF